MQIDRKCCTSPPMRNITTSHRLHTLSRALVCMLSPSSRHIGLNCWCVGVTKKQKWMEAAAMVCIIAARWLVAVDQRSDNVNRNRSYVYFSIARALLTNWGGGGNWVWVVSWNCQICSCSRTGNDCFGWVDNLASRRGRVLNVAKTNSIFKKGDRCCFKPFPIFLFILFIYCFNFVRKYDFFVVYAASSVQFSW